MGPILEAAVLGLVQGLTEFLPVSSSGHLALFQHIFGWEDAEANLAFNVAVHLGSLAAVLIYVRAQIVAMFTSEPRLWLVGGVATIPIVVVGLTLKDSIAEISTSLYAVGGFLLCTAGFLALSTRLRDGARKAAELPVPRAFLVGCAQAIAIFPGISRSGSTLVGGLAVGLEREEAVRFSFLLAIPAIAGAGLFTFLDAREGTLGDPVPLIVGAAVAFFASLVAMRVMVAAVVRKKLGWFAGYCAIVGSIAILSG
ncbi:MAG: undecaprenyl-diphosphate phosphatase [Planctomycetota bacterium]